MFESLQRLLRYANKIIILIKHSRVSLILSFPLLCLYHYQLFCISFMFFVSYYNISRHRLHIFICCCLLPLFAILNVFFCFSESIKNENVLLFPLQYVCIIKHFFMKNGIKKLFSIF